MTATSKNIESIVKQWTSFDLKTIQHDLDVTTTEIASRADESDQSRRKLVELSRDFKKSTSEDVRKAVAPILKSFQVEIDSLSKRSKAAEKAFLEVYRHLSELSDPVPALEYAQVLQRRAEKVSDLEVENQKLRETLEDYNTEFADVKNQEVTIKQLREKIKDLEDKTESNIQQRIKDKEKELQRLFGEKERQLQNQQFELVTKYAEMEMRQSQLQSTLDHAHQEMFEYKSKQEDATSARSSEIDILNQDLERANERASNAERLVDKLREQADQTDKFMATLSSNRDAEESLSHEENERKIREKLELELAAKEREIAALVIDTQKLQSTLIKIKETSVAQISDLENVLSNREKFIAQLESKLHSQVDYDEIKRELTILKSIEFSATNRSTEDPSGNVPKKSLEILLLEKNRALQSEQTQIKVAHTDLETSSVQWTKLHCSPSTDIKPLSLMAVNGNSLESLDTSYVANVVRQRLAQHNIGQRVFARCILSLSQGTVSELLSKPKAWSKLTEKGKESYRKMWAWANSEENILTLKSISPRKGSKDHPQSLTLQKPLPGAVEVSKLSRTSSPSTASSSGSSSRAASPFEQPQPSFLPSSMFPSFIPSLLMQTTHRLQNESYPPYNILCPQPENYRNWLMLQEIVRNNSLLKQFKVNDHQESEQENEDEEIPLDLSMKIDPDQTPTSKQQSSTVKQTKTSPPPLTEQDLLKYRQIDTIELVQTIKDILSRYSISQRHFGEKILGLSQGSVSDILARPKPWELLTQKGREPFLRMRLFLDDSNAMKQFIQSVSLTSTSPNDMHANYFLASDNFTDEQANDCSHILSHETPPSTSFNVITSNHLTTNNNKSRSRSKTTKEQVRPISKSQIPPYQLPKIPVPTSMDTEQLSSQVRELLSSYSIGQRVFGEAVLNLSQGTVSEILSKPRSWQALSVKGREPYIRMYSWFHDTNNVQKLLAWKQERDALRRLNRPAARTVTSSSTSKRRCLFTDEQRRVLRQTFEIEPYPSQTRLEQLVDELTLPLTKISNWFHNARMRAKINTHPSDSLKTPISSASLNDDEDADDDDDDDDDDDGMASNIVPSNSSWLNNTADSDSSASPVNILSRTDDQKQTLLVPPAYSSKRFQELDRRYRECDNTNNELKQLNIQLEKDLLSVGGVSELFRRGPEGQTSDNSSTNETKIIKDVLNQSAPSTVSPGHESPKDSVSDDTLTAIVISQRERFRIRNVELENENVSLKQQIGIFQNETDKLRSDNIKLYEKIKFVQTYPTTRGTDDSVDRYSRGYDASLDPFTNFTKQEKQKKYESLKLHEKFALNFGRFILSSHQSRTFFVIYFILVHILIFLSLYKMVHVGSSVRDMSQICFDQFREHMAGVHGEKDFHLDHGHHPPPAAAPPPH